MMRVINVLLINRMPVRLILKKAVSTISAEPTKIDHFCQHDYMNAWVMPSFGSLDHLQFSENEPVPIIKHHKDVLVKVHATSVNPIDVAMVGGYGNTLLSAVRQCDDFINTCEKPDRYPFIAGRDFAGEVIAKGTDVGQSVKIGDTVYGVVPLHRQGCHAQIVVTSDALIRHVPEGIPLVNAAAFLYCGLTAWSALCITGDLFWASRHDKKALVIGAAGGVGSVAVQMLKAWNLEVVATCKKDAVPLVEKLGADIVIDYTGGDAMKNISSSGKYDIILDAAGSVTHYTYIPFLKDWSNSKYITLRSPLLSNTDQLGLFTGMLKNAADLMRTNFLSGALKKGSTLRWGYFLPIETGIDELHSLFSKNKINPIVEVVVPFSELPRAYEKVKKGHNRGKTVLSLVYKNHKDQEAIF